MSKDKISDYSSTANSNTDIAAINIDEGCAPSGINNAIRALMAQLKDFQTGAAGDALTVGGVLTVKGASINDTNSNELFKLTATASAVNEFTVANAATGGSPTISATGGDTNIGINLTPKGTGGVVFPAGAVGTPAITTSGDLNTGVFFPAADTIAISTGGSERARFDSSGNFLLNTTSSPAASAKMKISTSARTGAFLDLTATGGENWIIDSTNTTGSTDVLGIYANGATGVYLTDTGNFLVGTTSQVYSGKQVNAFSGATHNGLALNETANTSNTTYLGFLNGGTAIGSVGRVGATSAVVYNTTSDQRLKSNIEDAAPVLDKLMQVQVRQYDWTEGDLHQDYGFIAQELEPVLSGVVTKGKTEEDFWQLDYSRLTPHLLKAVQEQQVIIENLKARLDAANL